VQEAKAAGKSKATKKHVKAAKAKKAAKEGKAPPKALDVVSTVLLRDMIGAAQMKSTGTGDRWTMTVSDDQMNVLRRLVA
jgi:hypothetical protein